MKNSTLLALLTVLLAFSKPLLAQEPASGRPPFGPPGQGFRPPGGTPTVTAFVVDSLTGKVIPFADAALFNRKDSIVAGLSIPENGKLTLKAPRPGIYRLQIAFVGYGTYKRTIRLFEDQDLGQIYLGKQAQELAEVEIQGQAAPIRQKRDTTEFNAGSFKTTRDATTEDLITKMPGLTSDGSTVKAMGETVNQVTVDGKPFFGDDPSNTLKNLPADMVDKVQLFDQRSETSRLTGFDDGQRTKTLNIVTKTNRRKGYFGKGSAFAGNEGKYSGSVVANKFDGSRRITLLGQSNNVNQQNFQIQDLVGAMGGGGRGMGGGGGGGGFSPGGQGGGFGGLGNFLVGQQGGINTTHALGTNYSDTWGKHLEMSSSYFFNKTINNSDQSTNRSYITDTSQSFKEQAGNLSTNYNNRANARFEYKPDTMNTIVFRPRFSNQSNTQDAGTLDNTFRAGNLLSRLDNMNRTVQQGLNASEEAVFRHRFQKLGRSLVVNLNSSINTQTSLTDRQTYTTRPNPKTNLDSTSFTHQQIDTKSKNQTLGSVITLTEGIGKHVLLLASYQPDYQYRHSERLTDSINADGTSYKSPALSNTITSTYLTQQFGLGSRYSKGTLNFGGQVNYQRSGLAADQDYKGGTTHTSRSFNAILPQFNLNWRPSKDENILFNANTSTQAPSASQLQTVVNTSNLLSLSTGNPDLRQTYQLNSNAIYSLTKPETSRLISVFAAGGIVGDYIGNTTFLSRKDSTLPGGVRLPAGGQLTTTKNLGNQFNARAFGTYAVPIKPIKSNLNLTTGYNVTSTPGQINDSLNRAASHGISAGLTLSSNISENLDFNIGTTSTKTLVRNTLVSASSYTYWNQVTRIRLNWIFYRGLTITTNLTHTYYNGLANGYNQNILLWNATLGKKFGKTRQWEAQVQVYDILKQNNSVSRTVNDVSVQDVRTHVLQRYFMVGLTYTLRKFNGVGPAPGTMPGLPPGVDPERFRRMMMERGGQMPMGHPGGMMPGGG